MVKVINKRNYGALFHYAHFMCDCLFPEIIGKVYEHNYVVRIRNIDQSLGNFAKIYEEVMGIKNIELSEDEFNNLEEKTLIISRTNTKKSDIPIFRDFVLNKYGLGMNLDYPTINSQITDNTALLKKVYPEILLIERGNRISLIDEEVFNTDSDRSKIKDVTKYLTNGKERREIKDIEQLKLYLKDNFTGKYKSIILENISFEEQVKHFYYAKIIIAAHGAALSNIMFCRPQTVIIEVPRNTNWKFYNVISSTLNLKHFQSDNNLEEITKLLNKEGCRYSVCGP